ncbi:hypothetical protein ACJ6WF_20480 [Streptomyces sp. MMS24-I2-30]|uniref:hypothetical protein n=1 Tax=Streptomyces sp. MMS24-I2-30 TaxID=3351564 RepID=UPI003896846B
MNVRLLALAGVAACALALPLAVASAGPVGEKGAAAVRRAVHGAVHDTPYDLSYDRGHGDARDDEKASPVPSGVSSSSSPLRLGLGPATAARCGPELSSPGGIEAQTCVLTRGAETWARTYYRNATGAALESVLSLLAPGDRTVRTRCLVGADDAPGTCDTPRERFRGGPDGYSAVTEFSTRGDRGPLLLRSGSNSEPLDRS